MIALDDGSHLAASRRSRNLISMIWSGTGFDSRAALTAGFGVALSLLVAASAQEQAPPAGPSKQLDTLKQRNEDLNNIRDQQKKSADTEAAIKREIEQIGADRRKLNQTL